LAVCFEGDKEFQMYAVIEQGGKQYKVSAGDVINIELMDIAPEAETIELNKVLFASDGKEIKVGTPYLDKAKVIGRFKTNAQEGLVKGQKLYPTYFRRRKNSSRKIGHRQKYLQVTIDEIKI
jgi:large subunit ribosomal protein L21